MAILFVDSVGHYDTAQIGDKYASVADVTVVPGAGRLGGQALFFNAALPSSLTKTLTPAVLASGGHVFTLGVAYRPVTFNGSGVTTILSIPLSNGNTVALQCTSVGQLKVVVISGGVLTVCLSAVGTLRVGVGVYLEFQWNSAVQGAAQAIVRVNTSVVAQGTTTAVPTATYDSVTFGGGSAEAGTWYLCDLYVLDGNTDLPVGGIPKADGSIATLGTFLGNISVQALLPVADGVNLDVDNTPWEVEPQPTALPNVAQVQAQIATDSVTQFNGGFPTGNRDAFQILHPRAGGQIPTGRFGYLADQATPWPLYGVQWMARVKANTVGGPQIATVVRRIVTGAWADDTVVEGSPVTLSSEVYTFVVHAFQADPTQGNAPWNLAELALTLDPTTVGSLEIGIQKIAGVD